MYPKTSLSPRRSLTTVISLLLAVAVVAMAFPQPAQAATCVAYHTVQKGDTTAKIAHTYDLKWREIAIANNLKIGEKPEVGSRLCIPLAGSLPSTAGPDFNYSVSVIDNLFSVTITGLAKKAVFTVKIRDVTSSVGRWYKMGALKIKKNKSKTVYYSLPKNLSGAIWLEVCLKDQTSNELICKRTFHYIK